MDGCHTVEDKLIKEIEVLKIELKETKELLKEKEDTLMKTHACYKKILNDIPEFVEMTDSDETSVDCKGCDEYRDLSCEIKGQGYKRVMCCYKIFQEKLKKSENRYEKLFQLSPDAIVVQKGDIVTLCNEAAARLVGVEKAEDLIGKSAKDFLLPTYHENMEKKVSDIIEKNVVITDTTEKMKRTNGEIINIETRGVAFEYDNDIHALGIIRDISERKRTEKLTKDFMESQRQLKEALEYDQLKNEFFSNMSHEFKTPLNVILGTIQLLELYGQESNYLMDNIPKKIKRMKQNCYRLLRLVNNLIDITKLDCGFMKLRLRKYDIVKILDSIVTSILDYAINKDLNISFHTRIYKKMISIDVHMIERVILNLIANAIKFSNSGGNIKIKLYEIKDHIYITVEDSGIGIPQNKLSGIFERFNQIDRSLTRNQEGSGIGLSIVKSLVELHNGSVSVESEIGKGSTFTVKLPICVNSDDVEHDIDNTLEYNGQIERIKIEFADIYF
ncbi:PAS domain-containing sensor histidine kinase [Anaeromicrobium sediminis]|uniref:histidine kinase n=1 Tax=Anaeromicrobium sediminis TaxID=1478221 RepID=A0A267MMR3_9FIRM|nr:PAS domain-containing sensor histidine kinase [Anaeromicrobium sediminis]PAB60103.1 hypothetical protein CCE28_06940 [Anaeromicrobium sediminis]